MTLKLATQARVLQLELLLALIARDPANLRLRKDAIRKACTENAWEVARELVDTASRLHVEDAELAALAGFVYLQNRRYAEAEQALAAAIARGFEPAEVRYSLAFARFKQQQPARALECLEAPLMPFELPYSLILRARCLHHLQRRSEAIADCYAFLAQGVDDAETNGLLSLLLYEQDERDRARHHAEVALRRERDQCEARLTSALLKWEVGDEVAAAHALERLLGAYPQCGRAWLILGLIELSHGRLASAGRHVELAAKYLPEHVGTWHAIGWLEIMVGEVEAAARAFEMALAIDENFGETYGALAVVAAMRGCEVEAYRRIKHALRLNPQALSPVYAQFLLLERSGGSPYEIRALLDELLTRPARRSDTRYLDLVVRQMHPVHAVSESHRIH